MTRVAPGLEYIEELVRKIPMLRLFGIEFVSAEPGQFEIKCNPDPKFANSMGRMHGGFIATLIDTAMGGAVMSKLPQGTPYGTIDLNVKFVRKIDPDTATLFAAARVIHAGRTMLTADCRVADTDGLIYGHGSGTFLVYPK